MLTGHKVINIFSRSHWIGPIHWVNPLSLASLLPLLECFQFFVALLIFPQMLFTINLNLFHLFFAVIVYLHILFALPLSSAGWCYRPRDGPFWLHGVFTGRPSARNCDSVVLAWSNRPKDGRFWLVSIGVGLAIVSITIAAEIKDFFGVVDVEDGNILIPAWGPIVLWCMNDANHTWKGVT